jgi:hypothetical protein
MPRIDGDGFCDSRGIDSFYHYVPNEYRNGAITTFLISILCVHPIQELFEEVIFAPHLTPFVGYRMTSCRVDSCSKSTPSSNSKHSQLDLSQERMLPENRGYPSFLELLDRCPRTMLPSVVLH